jgi:hypothetical protein
MKSHWNDDDYYTLLYYLYKTENWHNIQDNASCTKNIFNTEYWKAKEEYEDIEDDDSGFTLVFTLLIALFVLL